MKCKYCERECEIVEVVIDNLDPVQGHVQESYNATDCKCGKSYILTISEYSQYGQN